MTCTFPLKAESNPYKSKQTLERLNFETFYGFKGLM